MKWAALDVNILLKIAGLVLALGLGAVPALAQTSPAVAPSRGLLDLASPVLTAIDNILLGWLPLPLHVVVWAALGSLLSMWIYRLTSRQQALAEVKASVVGTRAELQGFEGEFEELWPILRRNLGLAGKQLALTFVPAMTASLPVLFILAWMANAFDARAPEAGSSVPVTLTAVSGQPLPPLSWQGGGKAVETAPGAWDVTWPAEGASLQLVSATGGTLLSLPTLVPVRVVHQREWWNSLIGNPGGYLPSPGDVAVADIGVPQPMVIPFGPAWLRGWLATTLIVLCALSLLLKSLWRLH